MCGTEQKQVLARSPTLLSSPLIVLLSIFKSHHARLNDYSAYQAEVPTTYEAMMMYR